MKLQRQVRVIVADAHDLRARTGGRSERRKGGG